MTAVHVSFVTEDGAVLGRCPVSVEAVSVVCDACLTSMAGLPVAVAGRWFGSHRAPRLTGALVTSPLFGTFWHSFTSDSTRRKP